MYPSTNDKSKTCSYVANSNSLIMLRFHIKRFHWEEACSRCGSEEPKICRGCRFHEHKPMIKTKPEDLVEEITIKTEYLEDEITTKTNDLEDEITTKTDDLEDKITTKADN